MKKEIIQLAVAGTCAVCVVLSFGFQPAERKVQVSDSVKADSTSAVTDSPVAVVDSIQLLEKAIKEEFKYTRKTVSRINRKTTLLQSEMMRTALASVKIADRLIPPPVVGTPLALPEPDLDSLPVPDTRRGLFRRRK